jgi:hypothetical protein
VRIFGLVGLVLVLVIVGFVARKQASGHEGSMAVGAGAISPGSDTAVRTRQVQQDIQRSLDTVMRASRDIPGEP